MMSSSGRSLWTILFVIFLACLFGCGSGSEDNGSSGTGHGSLDTTFNSTGYVVSDNVAGGHYDMGQSVATDNNGRILIAGASMDGSANFAPVIWRYNANGSIDSSFSGGAVTCANATGGVGDGMAMSITTDADGKILVAGYNATGSSGPSDMVIWRYNADGTLDTTFNTTGTVTYDGGGGDAGLAITTDAAGKILVIGGSSNGSDSDMVIWRYNANGTPDTTFNGSGIVVHNSAAGGNGNDTGNAVIIDGSGKILVTGSSRNVSGNNDMVVWRYNSDGTLDTTFNGTGFVVHGNAAGGNGDDTGKAIAIDGDGRILVTGYSRNDSDHNDLTIWCYNPDGTLDTTFNGTGFVVRNNATAGNTIAIDSDGRILVAGGDVVWRYNAGGSLDTTFNISGYVTLATASGGSGDGSGYSVILDGTGNIIVAGDSYNNGTGDHFMAAWRYLP